MTQALLFGFPLLSVFFPSPLLSTILLLLLATKSTASPTDLNDCCLEDEDLGDFPLSGPPDPIGGTGGSGLWLAELFLVFWLADGGFEGGLGVKPSPLLDDSLFWLDDFSGELDLSKEKEK